jgi:hypothetical protein
LFPVEYPPGDDPGNIYPHCAVQLFPSKGVSQKYVAQEMGDSFRSSPSGCIRALAGLK